MSLRIDLTEWISDSLIIGETGLGVLGSNIPSTGTAGGSFLYNDLALPADSDKEIRALILTYPSAGTLFVNEDGSFIFSGAPDGTYTFTYQLYVDGVSTGSPATVTLNVGTVAMVASAISAATATSTLLTSIKLTAIANAAAIASGSLTTGILLDSGANSSASASGILTTDVLMASSAVSSSASSAALTAGASFGFNATASCVTSASITTSILFNGATASITTSSASLTTAMMLSANAVVTATSGGDLTALGPIDGMSSAGNAVSYSTSSLSTSILLRTITTARSVGTANLTVNGVTPSEPIVGKVTVKFKNPRYKIKFKAR